MTGDPASWAMMEKYNKGDIVPLEQIYDYLRPWIVGHPNMALFSDKGDSATRCPTCGSDRLQRRGFAYSATQKYQRFQCQECGAWSRHKYTSVDKEARTNILKGI